MDTIIALATPSIPSPIAIIRISGSKTRGIIKKIFSGKAEENPRKAIYGSFTINGEEIDKGILIFYPSPKSYTGEDMAEIFIHGNPIIAEELIRFCVSLGARLAEPGEFTLRAYLNGKMDLASAEAINSFIMAKSVEGAKLSLKVMEGGLSDILKKLSQKVLSLLTDISASIDFPEYVDEELPYEKILKEVEDLCKEIENFSRKWNYTKFMLSGIKCVIVGKPNVGKSTIFNRIVMEERAIVTPIPGTTRDFIDAEIKIGIPMKIIDTAGIRKTRDIVELEGIGRTKEMAEKGDIILAVFSAEGIDEDDFEVMNFLSTIDKPKIFILNKVDINPSFENPLFKYGDFIKVSALKNENIDKIIQRIKEIIRKEDVSAELSPITERQKFLLDKIVEEKNNLLSFMISRHYVGAELSLKQILNTIDELLGETKSSEIIKQIFSKFCIGK